MKPLMGFSDDLILVFLMGLAFLGGSSLAFYLGWLRQQVQYVILADGRRQERSLPVLIRVFLPFAGLFPNVFNGTFFKNYFAELDGRVISAGYDSLITGREIFMVRLWLTMAGTSLGILISLGLNWIVLVLAVACFFYPDIWLKGMVTARHRVIQRGLPFMLDLLTLCVEAGLDFMSALGKIVDRRRADALSEEMLRVFHAIKLGRTRKQALQEMRDRVNLPDLSSVINALIQADELGVSLGAILRIQADQLRVKRFQRAETLANQAPTKMLIPLVLIFIAAGIILIAPILLQILARLG